MTIAIILAAGSGTRFGGMLPKQFIEVDGKTVLQYTIEAFERHNGIDEITIVTRQDSITTVEKQTSRYTKVRHIIAGGKERYDSTLAALNLYTNDDDLLLFHDAVRPMVSQRILTDCIAALHTYAAVGTGVPTTDTIWQTTADGCIAAIPPRATLVNAQTPQGFRRSIIRRAYDLALSDPHFTATDDCGVVLRYLPDTPIHIVSGEPSNIKITYRDDLLRLQQTAEPRA